MCGVHMNRGDSDTEASVYCDGSSDTRNRQKDTHWDSASTVGSGASHTTMKEGVSEMRQQFMLRVAKEATRAPTQLLLTS